MIKAKKKILRAINSTVLSVMPDARVILYGSQARGDSVPGSDWDILVILNKSRIEPDDYNKVMYPLYDLGWEYGHHFSVKLYSTAEWMKRSYTLFYKNVESEGLLL